MTALTRRRFVGVARGALRLALTGGILYGLHGLFQRGAQPRPVEARGLGILRPPGALGEAEFLPACIRCDLCAEACETQCIRILGPTEGRHAGTPHILAAERACNLCLRCTEVCPSGALQPLRDKKDVRLGVAVVDERLCVSWNGTGACGACHTVCPLRNRAITQGLFNQPTVHADSCTGCGLCEEACIVADRKAIRVRSERRWS